MILKTAKIYKHGDVLIETKFAFLPISISDSINRRIIWMETYLICRRYTAWVGRVESGSNWDVDWIKRIADMPSSSIDEMIADDGSIFQLDPKAKKFLIGTLKKRLNDSRMVHGQTHK